MKINLKNIGLFSQDEINFDKKVNFIFGKNGCGKSTITKLIEEQFNSEYDIRIFQGFESVVGGNNALEAVILGEENNEINIQIQEKEKGISIIEEEIQKIKNNIEPSENNPNNLGAKLKERQDNLAKIKTEIDDFCRSSAREIKEYEPKISSRHNYDINDFKNDIPNAKLLESRERENFEKILRTEIKHASILFEFSLDLIKEVNEVNNILIYKIEEKTRIARLDNNPNKIAFAKDGLKLHKIGEHCTFCNNILSEETITELEKYFSADEVKRFEDKIKSKLHEINNLITNLKNIKNEINPDSFYIDYQDKVQALNYKLSEGFLKNIEILENLNNALQAKLANLFNPSEKINLDSNSFIDISGLIQEYNKLVNENNNSDLSEKKEQAKEKLRYHLVKEFCDEFQYEIKNNNLSHKEQEKKEVENDICRQKEHIKKHQQKIDIINNEIKELQNKTRNERVLVERINSKLNLYVNFELVHQTESNDYKIKCSRTSSIRSVHNLSTGEKNIIAFLYFMEKLNDTKNSENQYVIFDDPMNSNDDTVQYLIIEELQKLGRSIKENNKLIILTHNIHFYLNVKYGFNYKKHNFYRLTKANLKVDIHCITKEEDDYKTSYEALWIELGILVNHQNINADMLLNPIRRIIETYIKFNKISVNDFYEKNELSDAKKLFNVNSHSIDDLEADLNGLTKENIIYLLEECFKSNNALDHYNHHFPSKNRGK